MSLEVLVNDNQQVKKGQVLVRLDPRDYQAKVDQARAAVAVAESQAQGASVGVPLIRATPRKAALRAPRRSWAPCRQTTSKPRPTTTRLPMPMWPLRAPTWRPRRPLTIARKRIWPHAAAGGQGRDFAPAI